MSIDDEREPDPGFPEPPGRDPGDVSGERDPHHVLNNPVEEPDPTEWPDPYEKRRDPRDPDDPEELRLGEEDHTPTGSTSTSEPHPDQDPVAEERREHVRRDKLDE